MSPALYSMGAFCRIFLWVKKSLCITTTPIYLGHQSGYRHQRWRGNLIPSTLDMCNVHYCLPTVHYLPYRSTLFPDGSIIAVLFFWQASTGKKGNSGNELL